MVQAGTIVANADKSETLRFIRTAADTNGDLLEMEATYKPGATLNPQVQHYHPGQDEFYAVVSGEISTLIDGVRRVYTAGESFEVPRRTAHIMANESEEPAVLHWEVRPAMNSEDFLATVWSEAYEQRQSMYQLAVLLRAYHKIFRLAHPAYPIQIVLFGFLAFVGRLRGYKATLE